MARLTVSKFSCIEHATVDIAPVTVLIGPQASGKSVISKLFYFSYAILLEEQFSAIAEGRTLREFESTLATQFRRWFPVDAWGKRDFRIEFEAGVFKVVIRRRTSRSRRTANEVAFSFSQYFIAQYTRLLGIARGRSRNAKRRLPTSGDFDLIFRIRNLATNRLRRDLRGEYVAGQVFIPAGRSFFTSIGKAIAAFAESSTMDPLTIEFGKQFTQMREMWPYWIRFNRRTSRKEASRSELTAELLGGEIKMAKDREYIQTRDGREIPFSVLSSGQQEVLPLYMALNLFLDSAAPDKGRQLIYIEEPEAHLFPLSQKKLVEYLASLISGPRRGPVDMLITTHSPYLLSTLNNLIKAGAVADRFGRKALRRVSAVVPRPSWLKKNSVAAYAIHHGRTRQLISSEGLIDAEYLDSVSGVIAEDFLKLLQIENGYEHP